MDLFENTVSIESLRSAWSFVRAKNTACGIDETTISDYQTRLDSRLELLSVSLKEGRWTPQPYMDIKVPKQTGETRTLGLMSVEDKIVQTAVKRTIEPLLEKLFLSCSYAYRPGKGHLKCIKRAMAECRTHHSGFCVRCDIDNFFDSIDRSVLLSRLKSPIPDDKLRNLISLSISMGHVGSDMKWMETELGIPQGAILSLLLANFYLTPFDQSMMSRTSFFIRYSDDLIMWSDTLDEAMHLSERAQLFLSEKLGLHLNEDPIVRPVSEPVEFLGILLTPEGPRLSEKKLEELKLGIRDIKLENGYPTQLYWKSIDGIKRYYLAALPTNYRTLFENLLGEVIDYWQAQGLNITSSVIKEITSRLLGQTTKFHGAVESVGRKINEKTVAEKIESRKREYQKMEAENSELVISGPGYFVGAGERGLIVRKNGQPIKFRSAAVKHISIMSKGVGISSNLIGYCSQNGIGLDFFGEHASLVSMCLPPSFFLNSHWEKQAKLSGNQRLKLAKAIMTGKLKNQFSLCKYYNKYHKHVGMESAFERFQPSFQKIIKEIDGVRDNIDYRKSMMAYEGQAAELYWDYVRELLDDDDVEFYSRVKQGASDVFNCMLNYGYSLLYPRIWQALLRHGLNPYSGLIHHAEGNPNLVFDFIEIFRAQAVDRVVVSLLQKKEHCAVSSDGLLDETTKLRLTEKVMERLNKSDLYLSEKRRFIDIIDIQARKLAESISTETTFRPYLAKW